ncbi:hypothetical protein DV517_52330 [Streptomyces sp. S816]|nr:hypothetical protein DV517_52330 [Streptomyces sp. S816]
MEEARTAEQAGFRALWISGHFHPWNDARGQSPFVRSVIGALSEAVTLPIATAVTCPTVRMHPAATRAVQTESSFRLGLGTGEEVDHHGTHSTAENARLHTVPAEPVPIDISATT